MNIPRMDSIALGSFGYTEDEARFLCLVATHSGYFTCQQFVRFIHSKPGKRSLTFVRKLLEKGHASARPCLRNGQVYHLFSRNLYEAIGKDNVRFRRKHSLEYIHSRLAGLDFILGKLDYTFFETEQEKVRYFTEQLGIDKKYLPAKRYAGAIREQFTDRYFVDKFPMFLLAKASPPVVSFSFVDPEGVRISAKTRDGGVYFHSGERPSSSFRAASEQLGENSLAKCAQGTFRRRFHRERHRGGAVNKRGKNQMEERERKNRTPPKHAERRERERPHRSAKARPGHRGLRGSRWRRQLIDFSKLSGAPREIRTPDLLLRRQALYPAELRARRGTTMT